MKDCKVFLSYSHDSNEHRDWVRKLADALQERPGIHVSWDGYDLDASIDKNAYMEGGVHNADVVVVVATRRYKLKADQRVGGVGIETYMATAFHWDSLETVGKTRIVVVMRELNSVPNYLKGHLYVDFADERRFSESFSSLLKLINQTACIPRPTKKIGIALDDVPYSFTQIDDLLRIKHTARRVIVDSAEGTDFSGGNRIKFELWEVRSPAVSHVVVLGNNINIGQTFSRVIERFKALRIYPGDVVVLRASSAKQDRQPIERRFIAAGLSPALHLYSFKEYIWELCIDSGLKQSYPVERVAHYTGQELTLDSTSGGARVAAAKHLFDVLQIDSGDSAHLVVGPGGMGKTSLCLAVAKRLQESGQANVIVVLIQAEAIKRFVAEEGWGGRIDSVYQLYDLYARINKNDNVFERNTFELAVLCGNLVVMIDGLDEFTSVFQDRFTLESFLQSLEKLHGQLGGTKILLTARSGSLIDSVDLAALRIRKYELLGFDNNSCTRYLQRRFRDTVNAPQLTVRVTQYLDKVKTLDDEHRVLPFLIDMLSTVVEDDSSARNASQFTLQRDKPSYRANEDLVDHVIYSILRREEVRQGIDICVAEVVAIIASLVAMHGKRWHLAAMAELLNLYYDARGEELCRKISLCPLVRREGDDVELRYAFLEGYFRFLFLLEGIAKASREKELCVTMARTSSDSPEFRDLIKYFTRARELLTESARRLIELWKDTAKNSADSAAREVAKRAISGLLSLFARTHSYDIGELTSELRRLYDVSPQASVISGLYISGDFPAMDFRGLIVTDSRFQEYAKLGSCRFEKCYFQYTVFDGCGECCEKTPDITSKMIDSSCQLGDLKQYLDAAVIDSKQTEKVIQHDVARFLHSFFTAGSFSDNCRKHVKFSNRVPGLAPGRFDELVKKGYLQVRTVKTSDTYYEIAQTFRDSVRRFLTNNYPDAKMQLFIETLKEM